MTAPDRLAPLDRNAALRSQTADTEPAQHIPTAEPYEGRLAADGRWLHQAAVSTCDQVIQQQGASRASICLSERSEESRLRQTEIPRSLRSLGMTVSSGSERSERRRITAGVAVGFSQLNRDSLRA